MHTIHKFQVPLVDIPVLFMPKGSNILSFQVQNNIPVIWALVDDEAVMENKRFIMLGTGHPASNVIDHLCKYIGTIQLDGLVWHLFHKNG